MNLVTSKPKQATQLIITCIIVALCLWAAYGIVKVFSTLPESGLAGSQSVGPARTFDDLLDAIEWVESKGDANVVGDGGKAIGSFQIHKIYVDDVNRIICKHRMRLSTFRYADRYDKDKSRIMVIIYLEEYAGGYTGEDFYTGVVLGDWQPEKMARVHNGGPDGWKKDCTTPYWEKVKARLDAKCGDQYAKELMVKEIR